MNSANSAIPMASLAAVVEYLDGLLSTRDTPDYGGAVNGLQLENAGEIQHVGAAVDFSTRTVTQAVRLGCDLIIVHHGMFWSGVQPVRGKRYRQLKALVEHDVAVYASHLPLDRHPEVGNNVLLARELGLEPGGEFARYKTISIGVQGESDLSTAELVARVERFAAAHGGEVRTAGQRSVLSTSEQSTSNVESRRTRRWAVCTGAGASSETLAEALDSGIDTLIVGEGPHHTFVDAYDEDDLVVIYAGHYATETLGVRAVAARVSEQFGVPWTFLPSPTGS